jgi:hypothetical protein
MKRRKVCVALILALFVLPLPSAAEESDDWILWEGGCWRYTVTDTESFEQMNENWMMLSYDSSSWEEEIAPFGDRQADLDHEIGWSGENHGLYLITFFEVEDVSELENKYFYLNIYYDNTMVLYLNGQEIYSDVYWTDSYVTLSLGQLSEYLLTGKNILAVSLLDDAGGREFDIQRFWASDVETVEPSIEEPVEVTIENPPTIVIDPTPETSAEDIVVEQPKTEADENTVSNPIVTSQSSEKNQGTSNQETESKLFSGTKDLVLVVVCGIIACGMILFAVLYTHIQNARERKKK